MNENDEGPKIAELWAEVESAKSAYERKHEIAETARREETGAINRLNKATKAFDLAVAKARKGAPWNTDWASKNYQEPVAE